MNPSSGQNTPPRAAQPLVSDRVFLTEDIVSPLDWKVLFGLDDSAGEAFREVEIGCGNGRYVRRAAEERPGHLFLGIERSLGYARRARDRMVKYEIGNARILRADATQFLASHLAPASVDALHVYFTDPWPKRRHAKRRLFQTPILDTLHRILRPSARIFIKVDLFWYFEEIFSRFELAPNFLVTACGAERDLNRDLYEITGFEQKALAKKGEVFYLIVEHTG